MSSNRENREKDTRHALPFSRLSTTVFFLSFSQETRRQQQKEDESMMGVVIAMQVGRGVTTEEKINGTTDYFS
jgi:hypothetical protein